MTDSLMYSVELILDMTQVDVLIDTVDEILKKEGLQGKPRPDGLLQLHGRLRQQRLHLLTLVEEKHKLLRENGLLKMALESAVTELRIANGGESISDFYEQFIQDGEIDHGN